MNNHEPKLGNPLRGFLQLGFFIGGAGFVLALIEPQPSAEFVMSVCSAVMGGCIVLGCLIVLRITRN